MKTPPRTTVKIAEALAAKRVEASAASAPVTITVIVDGEPVPKGRPRFARVKSKGSVIVRTYTPEETEAYEWKVRTFAQLEANRVRWAWSKDDRFDVLVRVYRTHYDAGGDVDNYGKIALDSIIASRDGKKPAVLMRDDRYVRGLAIVMKHDAENPRMVIEVRRYRREAA